MSSVQEKNKSKILIVDDEVIVAADLTLRLQRLGYEVCGSAPSVKKALALTEKESPDLVLMDIVLQGEMDGIEAADIIRSRWGIPVVFLTAYAETHRLKRAQSAYPFGYILKPFQERDLKVAVEMALYVAQVEADRKKAEAALRESEERVKKELKAILEPDGDIGSLELDDIVDHRALQSMMDDLFKFTRLPISIIDIEGKELVGIGWQDICKKFHRIHPETCRRCLDSDTKLSSGVAEGEFKLYKCRNNMWDMATPIMVGGQHVGNIFMGQFFFDDETIDYELFRAQARKFGFDETEYVAALDRVPRWPRETVDAAMAFFTKFAGMISSLSYGNIRLARAISEKNDLLNELRAGQEKYRVLVESAEEAIFVAQDGRLKFVNPKTEKMVGYTRAELISRPFMAFIHPDDREMVLDRHIKRQQGDELPSTYPFRVVHRSGDVLWVELKTVLIDWEGKPATLNFMADITERKGMEEELRRSEALLKATQRLTKVGGWEWNVEKQAMFWTDEVYRIHGFSLGEITPGTPEHIRRSLACYDPADRPVIETAFRRCAEEGRSYDLEFPLTTVQGDRIWIRTSARAASKAGRIVKVVGNIMDITERKRAEEALRESEARLRRAEFVSKIGNWEFNFNNRMVFASEGARIVYGLGDRQWTIEEIQKIPLPEYRPILDAALKDLIEKGDSYEVEFKIKRPDTGEIVDIHSVAQYDKEARVVFGIIQDVTERKRAEAALRESENKFKSLFDTSPLAIALTEARTGEFVDVNHMLCELTKCDRLELIGKTTTELGFYSIEDRDRFLSELNKSGVVRDFKMDFKMKDGSVKTTLMFAAPIEINSQNFVLTVFQDITERKLAEEEKERLQAQLLQAQKMESVGTLAGGVAHDFNNLLQVIQGYNQLLLMDKNENDPDYSKLKTIGKAGDRAAQLVKQLLLFSRRVEAERRPVDLNREVEQALRILGRTIPKMIDIELHPGDRLWPVKADPVQIEQVLLNLGSNAADAMPEGGRLIIETQNVTLDDDFARNHLGVVPGRYVLIIVSDTGCGMDKETVRNIFDPFFTTKEVGKGTGLGLASVYGIVKGHGGQIICYSEPGRGAIFRIYLPAMEQTGADSAEKISKDRPKGGTETVLLVDDEAPIRDFVSQVLHRFGYRIMTASSGEEALETFTSRPKAIDLVILDLNMPGMGGHRCLRELLNVDPGVKVLLASGYSVNGQVKSTLESGASGFIGKPYQITDLLTKVRSVLDEKK